MSIRGIACSLAALGFFAASSVSAEEAATPASTEVPQEALPAPEETAAEPAPAPESPKKRGRRRAKKQAQQQPVERPAPGPMLHLGAGISFGGFYPSDVNEYLSNWQDSLGPTMAQSGSTSMFMNFVPRLTLNFAPIPYLQVQAIGEIGWSPKYVVVEGGDSRFFQFTRYSAGASLVGHLPLRQYRNSLFLGAGLIFHALRFEEYAANALGFRGQLGFRFYARRFAPEIFVAFDRVNGGTGRPIAGSGGKEMELSYSSFMLGGNFYFNLL